MCRAGFLAVAVAGIVLAAAPASAQFSGQRSRERYQKATKGANLDDFVRRLGSEDPDTRLEAVKSLGNSRESKAIEYLIQALGDSDVRVQAKAVDYLGDLRANDAVPILVQYLSRTTTDQSLKQRILAALGKIDDSRAAVPIGEFLHRDLDAETRGTAIFALGEIAAEESRSLLKEISEKEEDPILRRLAGDGLAKIDARQAASQREMKAPAQNFLQPKEPTPSQ